MIIDTHLHLGSRAGFSLELAQLQQQMQSHRIAKGIVSTVNCAEFAPDRPVLLEPKTNQLESNRQLLDICRQSGGRLFLSFWCAPATGQADGIYEWIRDNRSLAVGLKLHPFYSRMPLEDKRYEPYLDIARQLQLPVSVHTAADELSNPRQLLSLARRHPQVDFIMVHMGLCSDNLQAIDCLSQADNLYGDTTWVPMDKVQLALRRCGSKKLLFGSDAPIDGEKSYAFYEAMFRRYRRWPLGAWRDVMQGNAMRLFKL